MQVMWLPEYVLPSDDHVTFSKVSAHHRTDRPNFAHHVWAKMLRFMLYVPGNWIRILYHFHERIITTSHEHLGSGSLARENLNTNSFILGGKGVICFFYTIHPIPGISIKS